MVHKRDTGLHAEDIVDSALGNQALPVQYDPFVGAGPV